VGSVIVGAEGWVSTADALCDGARGKEVRLEQVGEVRKRVAEGGHFPAEEVLALAKKKGTKKVERNGCFVL
jgi:hypothetical protein